MEFLEFLEARLTSISTTGSGVGQLEQKFWQSLLSTGQLSFLKLVLPMAKLMVPLESGELLLELVEVVALMPRW
ncbi:MAG: hypothetical protein DRI01_01805 [Chloroflexi bacterium]|nr:MAG: hypothetical protein DRI01_01805 [Chloroflexota bacterium]